jgi:hypothetical protein
MASAVPRPSGRSLGAKTQRSRLDVTSSQPIAPASVRIAGSAAPPESNSGGTPTAGSHSLVSVLRTGVPWRTSLLHEERPFCLDATCSNTRVLSTSVTGASPGSHGNSCGRILIPWMARRARRSRYASFFAAHCQAELVLVRVMAASAPTLIDVGMMPEAPVPDILSVQAAAHAECEDAAAYLASRADPAPAWPPGAVRLTLRPGSRVDSPSRRRREGGPAQFESRGLVVPSDTVTTDSPDPVHLARTRGTELLAVATEPQNVVNRLFRRGGVEQILR